MNGNNLICSCILFRMLYKFIHLYVIFFIHVYISSLHFLLFALYCMIDFNIDFFFFSILGSRIREESEKIEDETCTPEQ